MTASRREPDDSELGEGGMRALRAEREENRILRQRLRFLEAMVMHCSNMIVDAVEQTRQGLR